MFGHWQTPGREETSGEKTTKSLRVTLIHD